MREVLIGQTDYTVLVKIVGTDGAPETGLTEASIDIAYSRVETDNDVTVTDVTPAALSALTDAHTDWGFEEVDATNAPGLYRLDIADAVFASGAWEAVVTVTDASGTDFYAVDIGFRLVDFHLNSQSAIDLKDFADAGYDPSTNKVQGVVLTDTVTTLTNLPAITANWLTAAGIADDAFTAAKFDAGFIVAASFAADVDAEILSYLVDDATRIDASALNTASTAVGSNGSGLTEAGGTGDQFTAIPWNASWDAEVQSEVTDSLVAHNLDHLCLTATAAADMTAEVADNTILARILSNGDTSVFDPSTDGLQPIRDRGDAAWITATGFSTHSAADVWAVATRVLTAGTNIQLPSNGLANITAWTVDVTGSLSGSVGSVTGNVTGSVGSLAAQAKADVNAEVLDVLNVDALIDGKTFVQAVIYVSAIAAGRVSGAGTGTEVFKGLDETTTRVTVTVDGSGNRTDITYG